MEIQKELKDISWNVPEDIYRADSALSYSILAKFEREGFNRLDHLFDKISTQPLLEGSMVDCLITGSKEEFDELYYVADFPSIGEKEQSIVNALFDRFHHSYEQFSYIPREILLSVINEFEYQKNWREDTRIRVFTKRVEMYYNLRVQVGSKTVVDKSTFNRVSAMVCALKTNSATKSYFGDNDPLSSIRRYYQLKFKAKFDAIDYRCMAD